MPPPDRRFDRRRTEETGSSQHEDRLLLRFLSSSVCRVAPIPTTALADIPKNSRRFVIVFSTRAGLRVCILCIVAFGSAFAPHSCQVIVPEVPTSIDRHEPRGSAQSGVGSSHYPGFAAGGPGEGPLPVQREVVKDDDHCDGSTRGRGKSGSRGPNQEPQHGLGTEREQRCRLGQREHKCEIDYMIPLLRGQ